jgi:hypothetical protein
MTNFSNSLGILANGKLDLLYFADLTEKLLLNLNKIE